MSPKDLTTTADLTENDKGTGALRTQRPDFIDFLPPCNEEKGSNRFFQHVGQLILKI